MANNSEAMAAMLLSTSANAYAAYASNRLLEKMPKLQEEFGDSAFRQWQEHFAQRIQELAAAISETTPELFVSEVRWSQEAFVAREVTDDSLRQSLICLGEILAEELPEAQRDVPAPYIAAALQSLESDSGSAGVERGSADRVTTLSKEYLYHILEGHQSAAIELILAARKSGSSLEQVHEILSSAQREIGRMWHLDQVSIAEEHFVTATTVRCLSILFHLEDKQPFNGKTVVAAAVQGNTHDIGIKIVSDIFECAGWRSICLGGDLPAKDIAFAVDSFEASLLLLSSAIATQLKSVRTTIELVRESSPDCRILVGGGFMKDTPDLWKQLGADGFALNPAEAVKLGTELTG